MPRWFAALPVALVIVMAVTLGSGHAAPASDLWERWTAHDPEGMRRIDHGPWHRFLDRYVASDPYGVNRVAYARATPDDEAQLARYVAFLAATPISRYRRAEQLAFWINLYNALTVRLVLEAYPVKSIRDVTPTILSFLGRGPWGAKLITVKGEDLSLDDIEHRILRPIWRDSRIHYAVNCAAVGCPNLRRSAFTGDNVDRMLDEAAREYVNDVRGVYFAGDRLTVSSVYDWYVADFGGDEAGVLAHLRAYAEPELKARLERATRIDDYRYDWALNDAGS